MTKPVGEYVYHASYLPDQSAGLKSVITKGLQPSADGYAGPGVYFAYDPEGGFYHVSEEDATMFRVKWADLVAKFGTYPDNPNGIQRDEDEIIVPGAVPANLLEVEYFPGEWWDLNSAFAASKGPMYEAAIDNNNGAGAVPYNADVDYFGLRVAMKPSTFLELAAPLGHVDNSKMEEFIRSGGAIGAPFLDIAIPPEWDEGDFTKVAKIQGHEGRHRMKAIMAVEGDHPVETHIFPKYYRARDLTPDFIKHINAGLYAEKSSRVVHGPLFSTGTVTESIVQEKQLDPEIYGEELPFPKAKQIIQNVIRSVDPQARLKITHSPEGYYRVQGEKIRMDFGITADGGEISANIVNAYSSYKGEGVVTQILGQCFKAMADLYGQPTNFAMSAHEDRGHGVWQHIAQKLGAKWEGSLSVMEGGWASTATQNTVITPAVVAQSVVLLKKFENVYNAWQQQHELGLAIEMGDPVGSGTYYKRDLENDPEREYGDIDVRCWIDNNGSTMAQRTTQYREAIKTFCATTQDYATDNGNNIIVQTPAGAVQVDLIFTLREHGDWSKALAPEYRVKGVISTSLTSALAEVLNMSFGLQGVQVKTRGGRPVSFRQSKDTELHTVSTNPHNWGGDIYSYFYQLANGEKPKVPANLTKHGGLKDEQRLSDIVLTIKALATDLEQAGLFGNGALDYIANAQDLLKRVSKVYSDKLEAGINSSKFDKAETPAAVEKANKTKLMLAKYRNEIAKLLLS